MCSQQPYESRQAAKRALAGIRRERRRCGRTESAEYRCSICSLYHLTLRNPRPGKAFR